VSWNLLAVEWACILLSEWVKEALRIPIVTNRVPESATHDIDPELNFHLGVVGLDGEHAGWGLGLGLLLAEQQFGRFAAVPDLELLAWSDIGSTGCHVILVS